MEKKEVFIRKTSGLVRPFSATDTTLIYTLIIFAVLNTTLQFTAFNGLFPGADLVGSLAISLVPTMLLSVVYWAIAVAMPRSGSDYVWFARTAHPALGFGWGLVYFYIYLAAGFVTVCFAYAYTVSAALVSWGLLYNAPGLVSFATWLQGTDGAFIFAFLLILLYGGLTMLGHKVAKALLYAGWAIQTVALLLMWAILGTTSPATFAANWDKLLSNQVTYQGILQAATSAGWTYAPVTIAATLGSVAFTFFMLTGAPIGAGTISGEVRDVNRSVPIALFLANIFSFIIWSISGLVEANAVSPQWLQAISWLNINGGSKYPLAFPPTYPMILGIATYPNQLLSILALGTFIFGNIAFAFVLLMTAARYWFAWAFDRLIPTKLAEVNTRFRTPHYALLISVVISIVSAALYSYLGFGAWLSAIAVLFTIAYSAVCVTAVIFPFTRWKYLLDSLPPFMRKKVGPVPTISLIALLTGAILMYATYVVFFNPILTANANLAAELFGGIFIAGIVIYYVSKWYHNRVGIDISLAFKEIPPS